MREEGREREKEMDEEQEKLSTHSVVLGFAYFVLKYALCFGADPYYGLKLILSHPQPVRFIYI